MNASDHWSAEYFTMIEDCEKRSERLSDWETKFIDSISWQLAAGRKPSAKQTEILNLVWGKATKNG